MENFTLEQLRAAHVAGAVRSVALRADAGAFEIDIETLGGPARLVKARSKSEARRFVDPRKALLLLRELGITEARVDTRDWRPAERELERQPRPDRAEAMRAAHQALTHTDWLRHKAAAATVTSRTCAPHQQVMNAAQAIINRRRKTPADGERE